MSLFFSFVIPTYNRSALLKLTLESILQQHYTGFEIIVIDDGGTDDTEGMIAAIGSPQIKYLKKANGERGAARNYGAVKARGKYINFFDSDDLAYPNHLSAAVRVIGEKDSPAIFHLNYDFKKPDGRLHKGAAVQQELANDELIRKNFLSCNGVFVRKDIALQFPFPEDRRMAVSEDWALWLQLAARYPIYCDKEVTSAVVMHDQRSIHDWDADKIVQRDTLLIDYLMADQTFTGRYASGINRFIADRFTFFALLYAIRRNKKQAFHNLRKAWGKSFSSFFSKRSMASLKKIFFS